MPANNEPGASAKITAQMTQAEQRETELKEKSYWLEVWKTWISGVSVLATVITVVALFLNYRSSEDNIKLTQQNTKLTEERLITDRFSKAVEQIGSDKNKEEIILGGIYSLERIAKDSPKDQWTIIEVLASFIRQNSPISNSSKSAKISSQQNTLGYLKPMSITVEAALTAIQRRNPKHDKSYSESQIDKEQDKCDELSSDSCQNDTINLSLTSLVGANFGGGAVYDNPYCEVNKSGADLKGANLKGADLRSANLEVTYLSRADLSNANLKGSDLSNSDLENAILQKVDMSEANMTCANLRGAYLVGANLKGASLKRANLTEANLTGADLTGVNFDEAKLSKAMLNGVKGINDSALKELIKRTEIKEVKP